MTTELAPDAQFEELVERVLATTIFNEPFVTQLITEAHNARGRVAEAEAERDTARQIASNAIAEAKKLRAELAETDSDTVVLGLRSQLTEARARYDAEEVIVDGNVFRRGNLPTILANYMDSSAEHAREAKALATKLAEARELARRWQRDAHQHRKIADSRPGLTQIERAEIRQAATEIEQCARGLHRVLGPDPAERVEPRHFALYGAVTTACGKAIPPDSPWEPSRGDWALATLTTRRASTTCQSCINRFDSESAGLDNSAPITLAQAAGHLHDWAGDLAGGARTDWPAGHPDIIHGIRAAADWLDARDRYETETREQHLTAVREAGQRLGESFQHLGEAIRDGAAKARAAREQTAAEMPDVDGWTIYPTTDGGLMVSHDTDADRPVLAADDSIPLAAVLAFIADADDATEGDPK